MKAPQVPTTSPTGVGQKNSAHTEAPGTAIVERPDPEVGSNTGTTLSKKSGAVQ